MAYQPLTRLGQGGMGVVDLATRPDGTQVALKRIALHGSTEGMARARQRIAREADVLRRLSHPNIVPLLDVVESDDEVTLVMPYLPGGTLADRVARHGPAPAAEVERLAPQLAGALAAAHRAGVVHRDLKPANVLFDGRGVPHLADFGVATTRDDTAGLTAVGTVVGTAGFIAPEQARGEAAGTAADVFALGATLRFAATGEGPYGTGAPEALMVRAAQGKVRPLPRTLPRALRRQLDAMLDPRPHRRPSAAALAGGPFGTQPGTGARTTRRPRRPRRWALLGGIGTAAVLIGAVVFATRAPHRADADEVAPTDEACVPLPYQPCGAERAPNTDGETCLAGFDDYDEDAANGCEAEPDEHADGAALADQLEATIVPRDDVDTFAVEVDDHLHLLCDGRLSLTLTAPPGATLRLELLDGDTLLDETTSADGVASTLSVEEPSCLGDDGGTYTARVSSIGSDRSAEPYHLERSGSF